MEKLNELESAVLEKLLAGDHPTLAVLRLQAANARLTSREYTGAGFYCVFEVAADIPVLPMRLNFEFGDVEAKIDGLAHGAGFVIFVREGRLELLEGYSYDEPWPDTVNRFDLRYQSEPRSIQLPAGI